ncbi:MAG: carboxypeptidase regulatory-like domain-containing protein, partial [Candidatus Cloacimonetes bacterium]|nr:carboxypeptidase regulatory-like domain-containing protein [Candidatus Cloacimonadota bacterium]
YTLCKEQIRTFPYSIQTPIFTTCYGGAGATNNDIIDFVNNTSCGIFNYRGHGSETEFWQWGASGSFTNTHIQQFTNANRYFVLFDVCCSNMDIVGYNGNCLCESFMKSPVAAIAINGAIEPSYTIPNHDYDKEMYKAIFDQGINNIGYITNYANVYVVNNHPSYGPPNFRTYLWLGDSSLEPWTLQPADLIVSHDAQLFLGLSTFDVTVMGTGGPLENARVCVSNEDGTIYGIAFTDASGFAQVQFDEPVQTPGTAKVTVTSHNFLPYQQDIPVIPQSGPYVIYESFIINDSVGNNNGLMDYSESILLTLSVENVGIAVANNVTVTLSTTDLYVTITDSTEFYGDIPVGGIVTVNDGFAFDVANDIPDGHYVLFDVSATDGTDVWESSFSIEAHAPVLEFYEFLIDDTFSGNGDYMWDPGETVDIVVTLANNGSSDAFNVFGELTTSDPYVTLNTTGAQPYGDMIFGNTAEQSFNATSDENTPEAHMVEFIIDITADQGITGSGTFETQIGGYLIEEYFDSWLPAGWTTTGGTNWGSGSGNNAGGTPPEAQFSWSPSTTATQRLISLPVNTTGSATLELEFKHMVDHYGGTYQLRVETTSDGGSTWNIVQTWPAQNLSATIEELIIDNNDVGSSTFQVAWVFDGYSWNINYWYVDDVILGGGTSSIVGTIAGHVTLTGGSGNVQDVLVSAGGFSTNPYASGDYAFQVPPGTYDVTAELPGYIPQTVTGVVVEDGVTTSDIDFTLEALSAPTNLV